ncbi:MAG TPA: glycosyltransferase [Lentimicrobium sp.]|nr:glycosyltransferase [Lentimicrobium sp.]
MSADISNRIIIAPLDWGLGHATRCIPVIYDMLGKNLDVLIAGEGGVVDLLRSEFPGLAFLPLKGYRVQLPGRNRTGWYFLTNLPRLAWRVWAEHRWLKQVIEEYDIQMVISDNRYGLWSNKVKSVLITHQLNIIAPPGLKFAEPLLRRISRFFIGKFTECWIPDKENEPSLAGELCHGHGIPANAEYIGFLSRFERERVTDGSKRGYDVVALLSGPEPQRSVFEELLLSQLKTSRHRSLLLRGVPGSTAGTVTMGNLTVMSHMKANELYVVLKNSRFVVCRGGYSTLMDLAYTGNKVICVPTPGQTEQEYLAARGARANMLVCAAQQSFSLDECLAQAETTSGISRF